jgi:hypothetical protein
MAGLERRAVSDHGDLAEFFRTSERFDVTHPDEPLIWADAILSRWRLVGRYKCWYKPSHGYFTDPTDMCCGQPVIPWEEESVR